MGQSKSGTGAKGSKVKQTKEQKIKQIKELMIKVMPLMKKAVSERMKETDLYSNPDYILLERLIAETQGNPNKRNKLNTYEQYKYRRPTGFRKGVRKKSWEKAKKKSKDKKVRDPLTKKVMKENEDWDMGHKPGHEFRKHQISAARRGISRKKFIEEHNNPDNYVPELPSSNRGHILEDDSDNFLGP